MKEEHLGGTGRRMTLPEGRLEARDASPVFEPAIEPAGPAREGVDPVRQERARPGAKPPRRR